MSAAERERRKLERDLHDGAQQHLVAASISLTLAEEADDAQVHHDRIDESRREIEAALIELREISQASTPPRSPTQASAEHSTGSPAATTAKCS